MSESEFPPQQQERPGHEGHMEPEPHDEMRGYQGSGKLDGLVALVTGGDSGIGRAVCAVFATFKTNVYSYDEIAPSYVLFASGALSSYYMGEVLAPTRGETLPG